VPHVTFSPSCALHLAMSHALAAKSVANPSSPFELGRTFCN